MMKKTLCVLFLLCLCFIGPLHGATLTPTTLTLKINQLAYLPEYIPQTYDNMFYISAEDLATMTYSTLTHEENQYKLTIQNQKITLTPDSRYVEVNGIIKIISHPCLTTSDTLYIPLALLDFIPAPYTFSSDDLTLNLAPYLPYSTATDTYKSHKLLSTSYKTFHDIFTPFGHSVDSSSLIQTAFQAEQYLSIANTTYKKEALSLMRELLPNDKQIQVHFRNLDLSGDAPKLSNFTSLPLKYQIYTDSLSLQLGDNQLTANCFWATYNPSASTTSIDLNKSLDVMLMRSLYEYYRSLYPLKDDLHVMPITIVQRGRSDAVSYPIYLEHFSEKNAYQLVIYKQCRAQTVDYYVDLKIIS